MGTRRDHRPPRRRPPVRAVRALLPVPRRHDPLHRVLRRLRAEHEHPDARRVPLLERHGRRLHRAQPQSRRRSLQDGGARQRDVHGRAGADAGARRRPDHRRVPGRLAGLALVLLAHRHPVRFYRAVLPRALKGDVRGPDLADQSREATEGDGEPRL